MSWIITLVFVYLMLTHYLMNKSRDVLITGEVTHIIILGFRLKQNEMTPFLQARLLKGAALAKQFPNAIIIVTGGTIRQVEQSEAFVMKNFLVQNCRLESGRIFIEDQSTTSFENLQFSQALLSLNKVAIVTNDFHTLRVRFIQKYLGINGWVIGTHTNGCERLYFELREHGSLLLFLIRSLKQKFNVGRL